MKLKTGWLGPAVVSAFTLAVACGGSSDDNNNGGNGGGSGGTTAGKGGSSTSGSTSTAGTSSGGSNSTAGRTSGGTGGSGGSRNSGGTTNTGGIDIGFGGGGFDPEDFACNPVPEDGAECEAGTTPCLDGTKVCYCQNQEWSCTDLGGFGGTNGAAGTGPIGNIECPDAKPTNGTPCGDAVGFCPYGDGFMNGCACYQGNWACLGG